MPMMKTRTIVQLVLGKLVGISFGSVADYYFGRKPATPLHLPHSHYIGRFCQDFVVALMMTTVQTLFMFIC